MAAIIPDDQLVILAVYGIYALVLLGFYGLVCLALWLGGVKLD